NYSFSTPGHIRGNHRASDRHCFLRASWNTLAIIGRKNKDTCVREPLLHILNVPWINDQTFRHKRLQFFLTHSSWIVRIYPSEDNKTRIRVRFLNNSRGFYIIMNTLLSEQPSNKYEGNR